MDKPRTVVDYERLSDEIVEQIKLTYPYGYDKHLITFVNRDGENKKALRFETEEKIYLVRMTVLEARQIIEDDDDYDEDGNLKDDVREEYEDKYSDDDEEDLDEIADPDTVD